MGIETQPGTQLSAVAADKTVDFKFGEDFVGVDMNQRPDERLEGSVVFVGHGIRAPGMELGRF